MDTAKALPKTPFSGTCSEQILVGKPKGTEIFQDPHRVAALGNFSQTIPAETGLIESGQQLPERIFIQREIAHVHRENLVLQKIEIVVETLAVEIGLIGVPTDTDVLVAVGV